MRSCEISVRKVGFAVGVAALSTAGCCYLSSPHGWKHKTTPAIPELSADELRERAHRTFERAIFYKPREESLVGIEGTFAPLIVQEGPPDGVVQPGFGAVVGTFGREQIDPDRPTVYVDLSKTLVGSTELQQVTYVWRFAASVEKDRRLSHIGQGVRVTLGLDGLPIVWESLSSNEGRTLFFVSKSLEDAARREFGTPLEGRWHSIERSVSETRQPIVVRLLDDGPVAMGPYVYVGAPVSAGVTTVLCRCMPSQVDRFSETRYYNLVPVEALLDALPPRRECGLTHFETSKPTEDKANDAGIFRLLGLNHPCRLDELLRWPKEYR